jgi:hypothetical protein
MTPLADLDRQLDAAEADERMAACWYGFDVGMRLADAATWEDGVDELAAFAAGSACASGRGLLPLPARGTPVPIDTLTVGEAAALLDRASHVLDAAARESDTPDEVAAWHTAAARAHDGAECLRAMRRPG